MKAVYVNEAHRLEIVELPKPEIRHDNEVLIRITSAGICSSDQEIAAGVHPFARYPMIIGHEFGGVVEAVGAGVSRAAVGDKVTVDPVTSCGRCHSCLRGKPNVCLHLAIMGVHRDGGFAQYAVVPEQDVYVFRSPDVDVSLLGLAEPYSIGMQANFRAGTRKGDRVMVLGAGPIGICAMQEARWRGAEVTMTVSGAWCGSLTVRYFCKSKRFLYKWKAEKPLKIQWLNCTMGVFCYANCVILTCAMTRSFP